MVVALVALVAVRELCPVWPVGAEVEAVGGVDKLVAECPELLGQWEVWEEFLVGGVEAYYPQEGRDARILGCMYLSTPSYDP
uniref:Putative secreted protein n=1 Tax=Ixodes ricinus TaxID=34613 RepID=A0A6B0TZ12_IXORI